MTVPFQAATWVGACSVVRTVAACAAAAGTKVAPIAAPARRRLRRRWDMTTWWRARPAGPRDQGGGSPHPSRAEVAPHHRRHVGDRPRSVLMRRLEPAERQRPERVDAMHRAVAAAPAVVGPAPVG